MSTLIDKEEALLAVLSQIKRNHGKGSVMRLGQCRAVDVEAVPTGSLELDLALV